MPLNNPAIGLDDLIQNEIPTGAINNTNSVYVTANDFETGSLVVYLNGIRQDEGVDEDYQVTGTNEFTFNDPPKSSPGNPDKISVDYKIA
jgi:hypothetical protein